MFIATTALHPTTAEYFRSFQRFLNSTLCWQWYHKPDNLQSQGMWEVVVPEDQCYWFEAVSQHTAGNWLNVFLLIQNVPSQNTQTAKPWFFSCSSFHDHKRLVHKVSPFLLTSMLKWRFSSPWLAFPSIALGE